MPLAIFKFHEQPQFYLKTKYKKLKTRSHIYRALYKNTNYQQTLAFNYNKMLFTFFKFLQKPLLIAIYIKCLLQLLIFIKQVQFYLEKKYKKKKNCKTYFIKTKEPFIN